MRALQKEKIAKILSQLFGKKKSLKDRLKVWNTKAFSNGHNYVKEAEQNLYTSQNGIQTLSTSNVLLNFEKNVECELEKALERQGCFWKEKLEQHGN